VPELVRHGKDGFLHPVGDITGMAGSLARLLGDPLTRRKMGDNAEDRILNSFTTDKLVERTIRQYAALLGNVHICTRVDGEAKPI
jgi:glycosyltransferase involved in cell wall biosynthesis